MEEVRLYTHYVTPIFAKLNSLGLLHLVEQLRGGCLRSVDTWGYGYTLKVLTMNTAYLYRELSEILRRETSEILSIVKIEKSRKKSKGKEKKEKEIYVITVDGFNIDTQFLYAGAYETVLLKSVRKATSVSEDDLKKLLCVPITHDRRVDKGKSPTLLLAPDLGKYSSSTIPYSSMYPDVLEIGKGRDRWSLCTVIALLGLGYCSFKLRILKEQGVAYLMSFPSVRCEAPHNVARIVYWLGRRLSYLSKCLGFNIDTRASRKERYELSVPGILALLAPLIKDGVQSSTILAQLEISIFSIEIEREGGQYVRTLAIQSLDYVTRLPNRLAGAMLTKLRELRFLVIDIPEFLNLLGEYLLSGSDISYLEALRCLTSALSDPNIGSSTRRLARYILEHAKR